MGVKEDYWKAKLYQPSAESNRSQRPTKTKSGSIGPGSINKDLMMEKVVRAYWSDGADFTSDYLREKERLMREGKHRDHWTPQQVLEAYSRSAQNRSYEDDDDDIAPVSTNGVQSSGAKPEDMVGESPEDDDKDDDGINWKGVWNWLVGIKDYKPEHDDEDEEDGEPKQGQGWFQSGALADGFDWSDVPKVVLGTAADALEGITAGLTGMGEAILDAGAWLAPYQLNELNAYIDWTDPNQVAMLEDLKAESFQQSEKFIKKDLYDEAALAKKIVADPFEDYTNIDLEANSILAEKADSTAQSAGQLVGQAALQAIGVPWFITSATTAFGSEVEAGLNEGSTFGEAGTSGAITAAGEVIGELLSGGIKFGGKTLDDGVSILLGRGIANDVWRSIAKLGIDVVGEGGEEVFSDIVGKIGRMLTYEDETTLKDILFSKEAWDEYKDSAIGGGLLGGISSGGKTISSIGTDYDYASDMSKTEKKVVDAVYKSRLAEEGDDVSFGRKNDIYKEVIEDMENGYITTSEIESVLGGDSYKTYRQTVDNENAILQEYDALGQKKNATLADQARYTELTPKVKEIHEGKARAGLEAKVRQDTMSIVRGTRLMETYNERTRRGQAFQADVSQYDAKQQRIIQKAIDSGILNNTRRSHEFVDFVAKISADQGIDFDFSNNEKIKASGYAIEGQTVNGFVTDGGITINVDSSNALNKVVGHEITHVLEGTELYDAMQTAVYAYAETKGVDLTARKKAIVKKYGGVKGADINSELTADLVGEYLFNDRDFVNRLSTSDRTVFEKVFDEIKHLVKKATAGSKEKRQLEKVKKAFEDAYREGGKTKDTPMKTEVQYSLSNDSAYMGNAITLNESLGILDGEVLETAKAVRERVATRMNEIKDKGLVGLPEDIEGNTYIANSSYDGTEENTTICPRSLASEAFTDAVSEYLGRPLTVEEQIYISQDLQGRTLTPECIYCYVATDRKAYRAFLGEYINQRDSVIDKLKANPNADVSKNGELYKEFLNGRKDTKPMYSRFKMWVDAYKNGTPMVQASHLANINKLMGDINSEFGAELKPQITDAMKYAQSASWAKKRVNYVAYNGHILKWKQGRIDKLNSHYGLRMYSFSDFHPAFVLENMQMITDASVRGLKMLGYTKDTDFVEIFAPTGMNINISTFGFESGGNVFENNLTGATWDKAKALRDQYPNVGITFVATNDTLVNWALAQDWIDVVIPYHLVRTGEAVAKAMKYTNYTSESADTKTKEWTKGKDKKYIAPTEHNNDKATYLAALAENHLKPRFERFLENPNYMKLVNECRQPASKSQAVQPIFNEEAANTALAKLEANGYYQPIGGSVDRMYEIAGEVAEEMTKETAPVQYSLSSDSDGYQLSDDQISFFQDSKVRDENGNLKVMYHGSQDAGFHVFDPGYSDDGISLFFVDSNNLAASYSGSDEIYEAKSINTVDDLKNFFAEIGAEGFEVVEENGRLSLYHDGDFVVETDDARGIYTEFCDYAGVGEGEANYKVYLNLKNPLEVDAKGRTWNMLPSLESGEVYKYIKIVDVGDVPGAVTIEYAMEGDEVPVTEVVDLWERFGENIADRLGDMAPGEKLENIHTNPATTREYSQYAKENGYDGVIFKNIEDIGGYGVRGETVATVAIAFDSNQIKSVANQNPTADPDIRYSLSEMDEHPVRNSHMTYGKYILIDPTVNEDIAPIAETAKTPKVNGKKPEKKQIDPNKVQRFVEKSGKRPLWDWAKEHLLDNGMVFEDLAKATGNRELEAKWNFIRNASSAAQNLIGKGDKARGVKSLKSIMDTAKKAGKADAFENYLLHKHHIDRMTVVERGLGNVNLGVFGNQNPELSRKAVDDYERKNPEFVKWAEDVYAYNENLRDMMVEAGIITQDIADKWKQMFPHYVPIRRLGFDDDVGVQQNSKNLRAKAPLWNFEGSNRAVEPLFETMAKRTNMTFKAIAKNNFGLELMNTLGTIVEHNDTNIDEFTDGLDMDYMFGENDGKHTYSVYENGQRVTFDITDQMYEAMKPKSGITQKKIPIVSHINSIFRGLTTQYNPVFALTNPIKDFQEVILNSQHPGKTYLNVGRAIGEMASGGKYYQEYIANGGKMNTYFDNESGEFKEESKAKQFLDKVFFFNDVIEMTPRLAEYIASRESGRSVEVSMLDAARVTTNFSAGGDVTKFANRNGATFLNASVQGAIQQVRNVKEAHQRGLMGYVGLATRWAIGGLAPVLLNNLMWDDDEEYEDLADYVKQDYYVIGKSDDGKFIRIPKGRTLAVLQNAMEMVVDFASGDDDVDMGRFLELGALAIANLAPNNPMDNNIFAPIIQVAENRTWYGEDLVPSRLQKLPKEEQFDEKTDIISKWLGETFGWSPYKVNYLLNQYSGGLGDFFLPMMTPRAESGDDSFWGTMLAPFRDKFTTDAILNSQTVTDFYDTMDELEIRANSREATEMDEFRYMYMQSISYATGDLYAQKREIQNSDLPDSEKYDLVREIQAQINDLMEEALGSYQNPHIDGLYAEVGSKRYNYDAESGNWYEIKPTNADGSDNWYYQKEQEVTQSLGISYGEYWNNRDMYNFAYDKPGEYAIATACGGYESYMVHSDAFYNIKADKDANGNSISGSRKPKIVEYLNGLDIDYGMKLILFKSEYNADDTYNYEIIDYLNSRDDISYDQMETILKELGFDVDKYGNISW